MCKFRTATALALLLSFPVTANAQFQAGGAYYQTQATVPQVVYPAQINPYATYNPYQQQVYGQQQQQQFGLPPQAPVSAAQPGQVFGLMPAQNISNQTVFGPPLTGVIDASPPTIDNTGAPSSYSGDYSIDDIANPSSAFYNGASSASGRGAAISNAAYGVGVRAGYAVEAKALAEEVERYATELDTKFDFRSLMLQGGYVVPPVITQINAVRESGGAKFLYLSLGAFEIVKDARVAIRAPNWRDYLMLTADAPTPPRGIGTSSSIDRNVWSQSARNGYNKGIEEARATFAERFDTLTRDYRGMQRYHELARQGAISLAKAAISKSRMRISDGGTRAFVGEHTIKLVVTPRFKGNINQSHLEPAEINPGLPTPLDPAPMSKPKIKAKAPAAAMPKKVVKNRIPAPTPAPASAQNSVPVTIPAKKASMQQHGSGDTDYITFDRITK